MKDEGFQLERAAGDAQPPFTLLYVARRLKAFWQVHDASGRRVGRANTRAGARLAVRTLYAGVMTDG